jgi:hypothetical protein
MRTNSARSFGRLPLSDTGGVEFTLPLYLRHIFAQKAREMREPRLNAKVVHLLIVARNATKAIEVGRFIHKAPFTPPDHGGSLLHTS